MSEKSKSKEKPSKKNSSKNSSKSKTKSKASTKSVKKSSLSKSGSKTNILKRDLKDDKDMSHNSGSRVNESTLNPNNLFPNYYQIQTTHQQQQPLNITEKCEGCYQGDGEFFCTNCGKVFCRVCDDQLHIVPAYRNHERIPLASLSMNAKCYHHNEPLRFYCESCDEPVCHMCQVQGPHNNQLHRVGSLFEVYRKYFAIIKEKVENLLQDKNSKIEDVMFKIEKMIEETKNVGGKLVKGINREYENVLENLNKCEGKKIAMLNYNSVMTQKDIMRIEDILKNFDQTGSSLTTMNTSANASFLETGKTYSSYIPTSFSSMSSFNTVSNEDMITFLLQYKNLSLQIDKLVSSPNQFFLNETEIENLFHWPEELNDTKQKLQDYEKVKALLKIKEDIIWNLLTNPFEEDSPELAHIKNKAQKEIGEWSKLSDKYAKELKKYNLVCTYCGCYLDNIKVNENCPCNSSQTFTNKNYTKTIPPENHFGTNRHFFAEPTEYYEEQVKNGSINPNQITKSNPLHNNLRSSQVEEGDKKDPRRFVKETLSNIWVIKVASIIEKKQINLFQVLTDFDFNNDGIINSSELLAALSRIGIDLDESETESLMKYLSLSEGGINNINIQQFSKNFQRRKSKGEMDNIKKVNKKIDDMELEKRTEEINKKINDNSSIDVNQSAPKESALGFKWVI